MKRKFEIKFLKIRKDFLKETSNEKRIWMNIINLKLIKKKKFFYLQNKNNTFKY